MRIVGLVIGREPSGVRYRDTGKKVVNEITNLLARAGAFCAPRTFSFLDSSSGLGCGVFLFLRHVAEFGSCLLTYSRDRHRVKVGLIKCGRRETLM